MARDRCQPFLPGAEATGPAEIVVADHKGVFGVTMGRTWDQDERIAGWMGQILELYRDGVVAPRIDTSFSFDDAAAAHHCIRDRKNAGKVLLTP